MPRGGGFFCVLDDCIGHCAVSLCFEDVKMHGMIHPLSTFIFESTHNEAKRFLPPKVLCYLEVAASMSD